jgi:hypothetical protein
MNGPFRVVRSDFVDQSTNQHEPKDERYRRFRGLTRPCFFAARGLAFTRLAGEA